uniref:Uncharacterized protein n=1 Tax=Rhizophora mucronata TaxID=61149 RepID=A0A2P2J3I8_RHIMU
MQAQFDLGKSKCKFSHNAKHKERQRQGSSPNLAVAVTKLFFR